ncbi:MAG: hypothetical protein LAP13_18295 [Acidobacteriia bacterium]|nr:hypothetical protein [Terriglobia bacterium]
MHWPTGKNRTRTGMLLALLLVVSVASGKKKTETPPFQYAGGTEQIQQDCGGKLEVSTDALTFKCPSTTLEIPFADITTMEYRPDLSRAVRRLKLQWKVQPHRGGGKKNRYFTILYKEQGQPRAVVLRVEPLVMRPYLAEIELKSGKRVEVFGYEQYE